MKERPILMSAPMVRAIFDETKTQTRRIAKIAFDSDYDPSEPVEAWRTDGHGTWYGVNKLAATDGLGVPMTDLFNCPYGAAGDRLWVKETFFHVTPHRDAPLFSAVTADFIYRADYDYREPSRKVIGCHHGRPSIFMTRAASRILLEIVSVRIERLNDITQADARAEGVETVPNFFALGCRGGWKDYRGQETAVISPRSSYCTLWESINGVGSWASNPWVWVVEFRRLA